MRFVIDETPDKMKSSCMYGIFYLKNKHLEKFTVDTLDTCLL